METGSLPGSIDPVVACNFASPSKNGPTSWCFPSKRLRRRGPSSSYSSRTAVTSTSVPVHVKYRDQFSVVIANDGALFPGTYVAMRAAHQMQMALKNMSGGATDPHAGHNH